MDRRKNLKYLLLLLTIWSFTLTKSSAFAVLSHEAIIDEAWAGELRPLLVKKYPNSTSAQIDSARAYLYGGSVLPDMGYMPAGSKFFSNLVHYVRTGAFMNNLLEEANNLNEYAFALGFLCHSTADRFGHPLGTNKAVPLLFPKMRQKYGGRATFEQGEKEHTRTEFSFDVFQVVNGNYEPEAYRNFIGFKVSEAVLKRAFLKTYGITLDDVFTNFNAAVEIFRFSVRKIIPPLIEASSKLNEGKMKDSAGSAKKKPAAYKDDSKAYNKDYGKPGVKSMGMAFFLLIIPKAGPLSALRTTDINEKVKGFFKESFDEIVKQYKISITSLMTEAPNFENVNWDTGKPTTAGEYGLVDKNYYELLMKLEANDFKKVTPSLKSHILSFYSDKEKLHQSSRKRKVWKHTAAALERLEKTN